MQPTGHGRPAFARWAWIVGLVLALVVGAVLRLARGRDIEFKYDEAWTFYQTQTVGTIEPLPCHGMRTSGGFANPGMSVWVFLGLARCFDISDPTGLARVVQLLNIAALVLLGWIACFEIAPREREPWCWATALVAVHPLLIVFHRKIWPPSVMPFFCLLLLLAWWRRDRRGGAFGWGVLGTILGQIHLSGYFLTGGLVLWSWLFDRRRVRWVSWWVGNLIAGLPLVPWLVFVRTYQIGQPVKNSGWRHVFEGKFWLRWVTEPLGFSLEYSLENDFRDFMRYPLAFGWPTYLVAALHVLLGIAGAIILTRAMRWLWRERGSWKALGIGRDSETAFTQSAVLWGFGLLLTLSTMPIHRHYLAVAFPLGLVWLARMALLAGNVTGPSVRLGRVLLAVVVAGQFGISMCFLDYIHRNQRIIAGDFAMPYRAQRISRVLSP